MYAFNSDTSELAGWIRDKIELNGPLPAGEVGLAARRVQDWLTMSTRCLD